MYPRITEEVVHREDLGDDGDILARVEWDSDPRDLDAQDIDLVSLYASPVVVVIIVPLLEVDHQLDPLLLAHCSDPEEARDIDDPDPSDLHMVSLQLMTAPDEDIVPPPIDHDEVIGDETVSPLYEVQYALTLPDPTPPGEEESDPVDIGEGAMDRRPRGEVLFEIGL